ncbi:MAG: hypothetical protein WCY32_02825 [Burkholderiaceae bacterium]
MNFPDTRTHRKVTIMPLVSPITLEPVSTPRICECLARWTRLTRQAQAAQRGGRRELALASYIRALWTAETLMEGSALAQRPDDCLAALVVSHHNLSDQYRALGQFNEAVDHLCQPHALLLRLAGDQAVALEIRQATWRHLRQTRAECLAWLRQYGSEPAIEAVLHVPAPIAHGIGSCCFH